MSKLQPEVDPSGAWIRLALQVRDERIDVRLARLTGDKFDPPATHLRTPPPVLPWVFAINTLKVPEKLNRPGRQPEVRHPRTP